jgi:outer membrane protein assembly factor BamA
MKSPIHLQVAYLLVLFSSSIALAKPGKDLLSKITLQGQTIVSSGALIHTAGWNITQPFSDQVVESGIERILDLYENSGYPYCQVTVEEISPEGADRIHLKLRVVEGPQVRVTKINWEGISPGLAGVLNKEINFQAGEINSSQKWEERLRILKNLPYVKDLQGPELQVAADCSATVKITVEERNNSFSGVLGYVPSSGQQAGYLSGNLALEVSNFLDGPRQVKIYWDKKDLKSYRVDFWFKEYWLFRTPLSVGIDFRQSQTDSTYSQVAFEEQTSYRFSSRITWSSVLSWERVYQKSYLKNNFPSSRKLGWGLKADWNTTDYRLNPRQGQELEAQVKFLNWSKAEEDSLLAAPQKDRLVSAQFSWWNFFPLWKKQTLAIKLVYAQITSSRGVLSPADLFKLGGVNSLRGYYPEQFWADRVFLTTAEYRFLLSDQARVYLFADMAKFRHNLLEENKLTARPSFKLGYGLGLWLDSKVGLVGLDFGLGQSDQLQNLKVHLALKNRF